MIRQIEKFDKKAVKKLLNDNFPKEIQGNLNRELEDALSNLIQAFVYVEDKKVKGFMVVRPWGGVYHLDTLVVDFDSHGKGHGKSLVEFAKEKCIENNIPQLNTCTFEKDNTFFYKRLGFVHMGELNGPFLPLEKKRFYLKWINPNFKKI